MLADFMEIGTTPARFRNSEEWHDEQVERARKTNRAMPTREESEREWQDLQNERAARTNVTQLDYLGSNRVEPTNYKTSRELKEALKRNAPVQGEAPVQSGTPVQNVIPAQNGAPVQNGTPIQDGTPVPDGSPALNEPSAQDERPVQEETPGHGKAEQGRGHKVHLRLFVVEDLSRDVIEFLGTRFDIEPAFFREHIFDYAWCNTRDPWVDPPNLDVVARGQNWLQLRFVRARYFKTTDSFKTGGKQAENFNIQRRPDDDENNKAYWDEEGAIVGITRTRASFWTKHIEGEETEAVGKCNSLWDGL